MQILCSGLMPSVIHVSCCRDKQSLPLDTLYPTGSFSRTVAWISPLCHAAGRTALSFLPPSGDRHAAILCLHFHFLAEILVDTIGGMRVQHEKVHHGLHGRKNDFDVRQQNMNSEDSDHFNLDPDFLRNLARSTESGWFYPDTDHEALAPNKPLYEKWHLYVPPHKIDPLFDPQKAEECMQSQMENSPDQSTSESGDPSPVVAKWRMSNDGRLMIFITDGTDELSFHLIMPG